MRKEFRDLASPETARAVIADLDLGGGTESVPIAEARGRVLAERIDAPIDVPGFDRASMDGYAVRARDTFGADAESKALGLIGAVHAGETPAVTVGAGEAAEISTGAVLPDGADAVVIVERTDERDGAVEIHDAVAPGDDVMAAGTDVAAGSRALGPGTQLTPREIGLLSALGVDQVPVRARPRVGVISTGDELVRPGEPLRHEAGQIHDVNSYTVAAGVEDAGGEVVVYPHVGDDFDAMEAQLRAAADECDLVLTSGSTSASAVDVVYRVIEEQGELLLHGVAVKPGKPMLVGTIGGGTEGRSDGSDDRPGGASGAAYVGLPGYPVSALTIFRTFVAPAIRDAAGLPDPRTATVRGRMAARERYAEGRLRFVPVGLVEDAAGELLVYPVDAGSGATTSLVEADGVVSMHPDVEYLAADETVAVELFSPDVRPPGLLAVGEDDPALSRVLDRIERPRYLPIGSRGARRRLRDGLPDAAAVTGGIPTDGVEAVELGGWTREWGLIVPADNPAGVVGAADLVDRDLRLANRDAGAGLRATFEAALEDLADERGADRATVIDAIEGFGAGTRGHASPARRIADGTADAGLGLRVTAERLGLGFVSVGVERVRVLANPDRVEKAGVEVLARALESELDGILDELPGFAPAPEQ